MMVDVESVAKPDERPPETVSAEGNLADHSNSASVPALQGTTDEESSPSDRIGNPRPPSGRPIFFLAGPWATFRRAPQHYDCTAFLICFVALCPLLEREGSGGG